MKRILAIFWASMAIGVSLQAQEAAGAPALEYQVKAAFLCNFLKFMEWPERHSPSDYTICIAGKDPFGNFIDSVAAKSQNDRPVKIKRLQAQALTVEDLRSCNLIFSTKGTSKEVSRVSQAAIGSPIVTVSEEGTDAMVDFVLYDGKVRFRIEGDKLNASGVKASSKLLKLALEN